MTKTGMVRRMDDLGRIVIPKEIRKTFGIHENDLLSISVDAENGAISLEKYQPDNDCSSAVRHLKKAVYANTSLSFNEKGQCLSIIADLEAALGIEK